MLAAIRTLCLALVVAGFSSLLPARAACTAGAEVCREAVEADTAGAAESLGLLQHGAGSLLAHNATGAGAGRRKPEKKHYWPHARGDVDHYGQTPYKIPMDFDQKLAWKYDSPNYNTITWGALIDSEKNVYIAGMDGVHKFSPDGEPLWHSPMASSEMPTLAGDKLIGMQMMDVVMYALDLETGKTLWTKQVYRNNGGHGDFVEVNNGVAVIAMGAYPGFSGGAASVFAAGIDTDGGKELWRFQTDCGLWNIMALFPDEETTVFNDYCGNVYRLGLRNGTQIWKAPGSFLSFTDGGSMLGPDGAVYTCSNQKFSQGGVGQKGVLRKHSLGDGTLEWRTSLEYPCVNFPAVSADGHSVIVAPGALAIEAKTKEITRMSVEERYPFFQQQIELVLNNSQRAHYNQPNLDAAIMAFDTETGDLQWRHDVFSYGGLAFAGDEMRAWLNAAAPMIYNIPHCWPAHWSAPTVDPDGKVFIGRSTGHFLAYDPKTDKETSFQTNDGALMAGAAFAPGMIAFTTCSTLFVFKTDE